jgi:hypothetical protein
MHNQLSKTMIQCLRLAVLFSFLFALLCQCLALAQGLVGAPGDIPRSWSSGESCSQVQEFATLEYDSALSMVRLATMLTLLMVIVQAGCFVKPQLFTTRCRKGSNNIAAK